MRHITLFIFLITLLLTGCTTQQLSSHNPRLQSGESFVLVREEPTHTAFTPASHTPVNVRSTYLDNLTNTIHYVANQDYIFECGTIRRTAQSRIPDFSTNSLFGKDDFDHSKFPGFGNGPYIVFVDYVAKTLPHLPTQPPQTKLLPHTLEKLKTGQKLTIVAFGDSITAGGEATQPHLIYWQRWADALQTKYPRAQIEAINGATGGDTTVNGLARLDEKVLKREPDLVLLAFGMNDHNVPGFGVPLENFSQNLRTMIDRIRERTHAEIVLISAFPPNPKWHFGSHKMEQYAAATEQVAREKNCAYADVFHKWQAYAAAKKPEDLLGNNINHPNDFGHYIYFEVLRQMIQ